MRWFDYMLIATAVVVFVALNIVAVSAFVSSAASDGRSGYALAPLAAAAVQRVL